jgi:16S rRNA (uracil1498-N3)-methyltransferase
MENSALLRRASASSQIFVDNVENFEISEDDAHHLFSVLRLRDDEHVIVVDGSGHWQMTSVTGRALLSVGEIEFEPPHSPQLTVGFAPLKGDRSEWAVAKLTELGIDRIIALECDHASVRWEGGKGEKAMNRWKRIAIEASSQSRRVRLPKIEGPVSLDSLEGDACVALAVPGGQPLSRSIHTVLIGPEGGWSERELRKDFLHVTLSSQILRSETAAVSGGALLGGVREGTVSSMESEISEATQPNQVER